MKFSIKLIFGILLVSGFLFTSCKKDDDNSILENFNSLNIPEAGYWNGSDKAGSFSANGITFPNLYNEEWASWSGFAYSKKHDLKTAGYTNQYSAYALKDSSSNNTFVVAYPGVGTSTVEFENPVFDLKMKVTNSTYAALSMKYGDMFSKKFGGADSTESDWLKLKVVGFNKNNQRTDSANVYLADFRFSSKKQDYIVDEWLPVNLSQLGEVKKIMFELSSSDNSQWGMNTPGFFCIDDIEFKPTAK